LRLTTNRPEIPKFHKLSCLGIGCCGFLNIRLEIVWRSVIFASHGHTSTTRPSSPPNKESTFHQDLHASNITLLNNCCEPLALGFALKKDSQEATKCFCTVSLVPGVRMENVVSCAPAIEAHDPNKSGAVFDRDCKNQATGMSSGLGDPSFSCGRRSQWSSKAS
jgi:hypothetical protein